MNNLTTDQTRFIGEIYKRYAREVHIFFVRHTKDEMRADDMTQDLFLRLMNYGNMIVEATAKNFVFTIAKRMVIDDTRHQAFVRQAARGYQLQREQERFWQDSTSLECRQIEEMERAKLRTLPPKMAQVYELTRFEEKTSQELAEELHISKRTVEYHLLVSRREIRGALRKAINM